MMGIVIALLLGYWLGKREKEQKQPDQQYAGSVKYGSVDYGYVREGESVEDLT